MKGRNGGIMRGVRLRIKKLGLGPSVLEKVFSALALPERKARRRLGRAVQQRILEALASGKAAIVTQRGAGLQVFSEETWRKRKEVMNRNRENAIKTGKLHPRKEEVQ